MTRRPRIVPDYRIDRTPPPPPRWHRTAGEVVVWVAMVAWIVIIVGVLVGAI